MSIASRIESMTEHLTNAWDNVDSLGLYAKKLPKEYTQVDYIASSGTQYIDTGYSFNNNLNVDISFQGLNNENAYYGVFGARESNNTSRFVISYQASSKKIAFNYGSVDTGAINNTDVETNKVVVYNEGLKFYLNNENIRTFSNGCGEGTRNCLLFTFRNIDNSLYRQSSIKLYYLKMYDNDVLIRDFIPCYRNSDNEVGLYDLVNNVFYTNQGTGVFTYGKIQEEHIYRNLENLSLPLNDLYNKVSNKTDLSQNGVVGRTSQESTTGKNLFNKLDYTQITTNGNGSPTNIVKQNDYISFASSGSTNFSGLYIPNNSVTNYIDNFNTSTNYYISFDVTVDKACKFGGGQTTTYIDIPIGKTRVSFYGTITSSINFYVRNAITDGVNVKIENIMVSTESDTTYEPYTYGASPNPDYPQPINNLSGDVAYKVSGKNLFNNQGFPSSKFGGNSNATITFNNGTITTNTNYYSWRARSCELQLEKNTNYTLSGNLTSFVDRRTSNNSIAVINISGYTDSRTIIIDHIITNTGEFKVTFNSGNYDYIGISFNGSTDGITQLVGNVVFENIQLEENSTSTEYEPYIEPQTFNIPLKSKNLFDKNNFTYSNGWYDDNGVLNTSSTTSHSNNYIEINKSTIYTISGFRVANPSDADKYSTLQRVYYWDDSKTFITRSVAFNGSTYGTFTTPNNAKYITFQVSSNSTFVYDINDDLDTIQLEENTINTDYEPYYDIELCKISTYQDRIYSDDGRFYLNKNIGKVVLDGTQTITATTQNNVFYLANITDYRTSNNTPYSNYYKGIINVVGASNMASKDNNTIAFLSSSSPNARCYIKDTRYTNASDLTLWLSTHNTTLYYVLATPTTIEITQENYPSLYNALKQIQDYLTAYKINKEFILGYDSPEIEY